MAAGVRSSLLARIRLQDLRSAAIYLLGRYPNKDGRAKRIKGTLAVVAKSYWPGNKVAGLNWLIRHTGVTTIWSPLHPSHLWGGTPLPSDLIRTSPINP